MDIYWSNITVNEINYSIIIPHKNIPELLQRCLASIPRRQDVQIIIIDDNSDADKVDFNKFPGLHDPCIEVLFTKEGKGAGYARNIGLTRASGKWLFFADADDFFAEDFLDYVDKYIDSNYDLIYFGIYRIDKYSKLKINICPIYNKLMYEAIHQQKYDAYKYIGIVPWGKMIKHSLITENSIKFDETVVANDRMFSAKTGYYSQNTHFDEHRIYIYEINNDSLTAKKTREISATRLNVYIQFNVFLDEISQKKYKLNLIPSLIKVFNIYDMSYFHNAIKTMKENKINIFAEILKFCLLFPYQKIKKIIIFKRFF